MAADMEFNKLPWQQRPRNICYRYKRTLLLAVIGTVVLVVVHIRSAYFFGFPGSWYYHHGCATNFRTEITQPHIYEGDDPEIVDIVRQSNQVLESSCVPLSFSRMGRHVSTLLSLSHIVDARRRASHGILWSGDQTIPDMLASLETDVTRHLFPYLKTKISAGRGLTDLWSTYEDGRAIVMPVGQTGWRMAAQSIAAIRDVHKSTLPIQVVYAGENDLPVLARDALSRLGPNIELLDILDYFDEEIVGLQTGGWAIKPFALLASKYKENILVDADTVFLQSPDVLFIDLGYRETGTWFFRDEDWEPHPYTRHWTRGIPWLRSVFSGHTAQQWDDLKLRSPYVRGDIEHEAESGVVVMNKAHDDVVANLLFTAWMNTIKVRKITYHYTWGDKESFWLPFELTHTPYHFERSYAAAVGTMDSNGVVCGKPAHLDANDVPIWHNTGMWLDKKRPSLGWLNPQIWVENRHNWKPDLCMHNIEAEQVHEFNGTRFADIVERLIQSAEQVEAVVASVPVQSVYES